MLPTYIGRQTQRIITFPSRPTAPVPIDSGCRSEETSRAGYAKQASGSPRHGPTSIFIQRERTRPIRWIISPECQISPLQHVPAEELARLALQVDLALGGKTQKLSRLSVEKTLAGQSTERWTEFLQIVQAKELSSLANTLDNELVTFIKQVLD